MLYIYAYKNRNLIRLHRIGLTNNDKYDIIVLVNKRRVKDMNEKDFKEQYQGFTIKC